MVAAYVLLHIKWLVAGARQGVRREAMTGMWASPVGIYRTYIQTSLLGTLHTEQVATQVCALMPRWCI